MAKIVVDSEDYKPAEQDRERLRRGIKKFLQSFADDAKKDTQKGLGLPSDWRDRTIRSGSAC